MSPRAWLLDASIYIFRSWFAMPDRWHTPEGLPLNAVVGYSAFLLDLVAPLGIRAPLAAAFDESLGSCFRNRIYPDYKCRRTLPDEALAFQLRTCRELTGLLGLPCYGGPEYEADDYLASLGRVCREAGLSLTLVSRDKDLGQLLAEGDELRDPASGACLDASGFAGRFGVQPGQFPDYQALVGDSIDDIPGVPGVGPRTAARLLSHYPDLDSLSLNLARVGELPLRGARALQARLIEHWPQVALSRRLARLETRVPGVDRVPDWHLCDERLEAFAAKLEQLGLRGRLPTRVRQLEQGVST
jgi:5'-3' exonuclease